MYSLSQFPGTEMINDIKETLWGCPNIMLSHSEMKRIMGVIIT